MAFFVNPGKDVMVSQPDEPSYSWKYRIPLEWVCKIVLKNMTNDFLEQFFYMINSWPCKIASILYFS